MNTMFSQRTEWELTPNRITGILEDLKKSNQRIFDLTESNPTNCGFSYLTQDLQGALMNPDNMRYSPATKGLAASREAVAKYYESKGITISPEQIFLTSSTSEGYSFLFRLLADPGNNILFPSPSYPLFEFLVGLNDIEMNYYPLNYENQWGIDFGELRNLITPLTSGIVLVNPNNPTGSFVKSPELVTLNQICHESQISIISDEVFHDYAFDRNQNFPSLAANNENLTFTLGGLSKMLGLPQMKLSWIVVSGPKAIAAEAIARLEIIADTYLSVNTPVQNALPVWMKLRTAIQDEIMTRVNVNRTFLSEHCGKACLHSDGGWYAVLKLNPDMDEEKLVEDLLIQDQVYVHPGYFFNFNDEPHLIISLLPMKEDFEEGLKRVINRIS